MVFKQDEVLKGGVIAGLGAYGIKWALTQTCSVNLTQEIMGRTIQTIPSELTSIICLTIDPKLMIIMLVATAAVFGGVTKIIQNI